MTKEEQITEFVKALVRTHSIDADSANLLMRVAVITKHISDGLLCWDEDLEEVVATSRQRWLH